jgi:hypothetical protein
MALCGQAPHLAKRLTIRFYRSRASGPALAGIEPLIALPLEELQLKQ